jgi:nicotinamide phosphoribosyltransferase
MNINPLFLIDFYKADHRRQYPEGTSLVYSNFTPRSNKYAPEDSNAVVVFGIQYLIKEYLISQWNEGFFFRDKEAVIKEYEELMDRCLGKGAIPLDHISELHDLGYLPIKIKALPEGTLCPIGVPCLTIHNTIDRFFWLTNYLETLLSNILWKPMTSATTAYLYRKEFERHSELTGSPKDFIGWQGHDFSMRGMSGVEDACMSGGGHLLSFNGTDSVPAIKWLDSYYKTDQLVGGSVPATEHSVMCMGTLEDEIGTFKRLITETYPNGIVSIVSDTWDFWKVMTEYLPTLKEEVLARDGRVVVRPDSGDPVDIICGTEEWVEHYTKTSFEPGYIAEELGAYEILWEIFGGTVNDEGFKVLNPKVGLIYGDSITLERQKDILRRLEKKGFCASNLVLGIGSYTYEYVTRDTYGFAMKATYGEVLEYPTNVGKDEGGRFIGNYSNGNNGCLLNHAEERRSIGRDIFKDPMTDSGLKKSAKGLLQVKNGVLKDQCTWEEATNSDLVTVFSEGKLLKDFSLTEIRNNLFNDQ